jgi:hypothetical protein
MIFFRLDWGLLVVGIPAGQVLFSRLPDIAQLIEAGGVRPDIGCRFAIQQVFNAWCV